MRDTRDTRDMRDTRGTRNTRGTCGDVCQLTGTFSGGKQPRLVGVPAAAPYRSRVGGGRRGRRRRVVQDPPRPGSTCPRGAAAAG